MTDSLLDKYAGRRNAKEPDDDDGETVEEPGFGFGWLRGIRDMAIMLEVRHKDGRLTAFPYSLLDRADFDPSTGIRLKFANVSVCIVGRNLNAEARPNLRLFEGILRRRVSWIQEADEATAMEARKDAVLIEMVEIK